ncbi:MAG: hypothetical protein ACRECY_13135 [Phyllobacterium sp.]
MTDRPGKENMMFDATDPRATLARPAARNRAAGKAFPATYARFYDEEPQESTAGSRTWISRGQTFVLAYTTADAGARQSFSRRDQADEFVLLLPDRGTIAEIVANGERLQVAGHSVTFLPPGDSDITLEQGGTMVRLFTVQAADLAAKASNAALYDTPNTLVPPLQAWPASPGGDTIRSYSLDVAPEPGRFGRIFRCSTFMVNYLEPREGPRDPALLSPHHHDDFEQCSLALSGDYIHHLRWPWTTNCADWRDDEHEFCGSPSVAVIPPPAIHTSQAVGTGLNQLVDIFCPPRTDFSEKPGWVLNAADYPLAAKE